MKTPLDTILDYHQRTKHHFQHYAAGPDGLDWKNQPDPFRTFAGSAKLELPLLGAGTQPFYAELYHPGAIAAQALTLPNIAALLELSFGLSAWKQYGSTRWALRCNPSSGNLHPTEAYLVVQGCSGIHDGVHHYMSRDHLLEPLLLRACYERERARSAARFLFDGVIFHPLARSLEIWRACFSLLPA